MNDTVLKCIIKRTAGLENNQDGLANRQQIGLSTKLLERSATDVLHYDIAVFAFDDRIINTNDIGVRHLAHHGRFIEEQLFEAAGFIDAHALVGCDQFDRNFAIIELIFAQIDNRCRATTQLGQDVVLTDLGRAVMHYCDSGGGGIYVESESGLRG